MKQLFINGHLTSGDWVSCVADGVVGWTWMMVEPEGAGPGGGGGGGGYNHQILK